MTTEPSAAVLPPNYMMGDGAGHCQSETQNPNDINNDQSPQSVSPSDSRPVIQYRKPGWKLRTFNFNSKLREYPSNRIRFVSFGQMMIGFLCLAFSVATIAVGAWGYQIGTGIWGGAMFFLSGGIGLVAYLTFKLSFIFATFVLSSASFLAAFVLFVVSCVGIEQDMNSLNQLEQMFETRHLAQLRVDNIEDHIHQHKLRVGFNGMLLFLAIVELGVGMMHALMNAKHFFVWDRGSTNESEYVYSNEGAEIEPDLPPTYQEAMGAGPSVQATAPHYDNCAGPGEVHPEHIRASQEHFRKPRKRYPDMDAPPVNSDFIEMQLGSEWDLTRGDPSSEPSASSPTYPQSNEAPERPSNRFPPENNAGYRTERSPGAADQQGDLRLGRGAPKGSVLYQPPEQREPMYSRPSRHSRDETIANEPVYANVQDYTTGQPREEYRKPQRRRSSENKYEDEYSSRNAYPSDQYRRPAEEPNRYQPEGGYTSPEHAYTNPSSRYEPSSKSPPHRYEPESASRGPHNRYEPDPTPTGRANRYETEVPYSGQRNDPRLRPQEPPGSSTGQYSYSLDAESHM